MFALIIQLVATFLNPSESLQVLSRGLLKFQPPQIVLMVFYAITSCLLCSMHPSGESTHLLLAHHPRTYPTQVCATFYFIFHHQDYSNLSVKSLPPLSRYCLHISLGFPHRPNFLGVPTTHRLETGCITAMST